MVLMFVFQLSACIAGYTLKGNTLAIVQSQLLSTMDLYGPNGNYEVTKLWDEVQEDVSVLPATKIIYNPHNIINQPFDVCTKGQESLPE